MRLDLIDARACILINDMMNNDIVKILILTFIFIIPIFVIFINNNY